MQTEVRPSAEALGPDASPGLEDSTGRLPNRVRWLLTAGWAMVGVATVLLIQPGLPSDEPAHWANLLFFSMHHSMPILGHKGIKYEAQQGPVAYVVAALVESVVHGVTGSTSAAFYAVRLLGGAEIGATALVAWRLLRRLVPSSVGRIAAISYFVLCPMFVAMSWSVQNDSLSLLFVFGALELALVRERHGLRASDAALVGVLVGLGLLTKLTAWPLLIAVPAWLAFRYRRDSVVAIFSFGLSAAVVSGWWFVRNVFLYRDLLGSTTQGGGPSFPAFGFHGPGTIGHALEEVVTYLWVPTEYYRDLIKAPVVLKGILVVLTIVIVVLAATTLAKRSREKLRDSISVAGYVELESAWLVVGFTAVVAVASWVVLFICSSAIAPRLAYAAIPCWLGLIALGANQVSDRLPHRLSPFLPLCVGVTLLALDGWELVLAHRLPLGVFHIILR